MFLISTVLNPSSKLITAMTHGNAVLEPPSVMFSRSRMYTGMPVPNHTNDSALALLNSVGKREQLMKKTKNDGRRKTVFTLLYMEFNMVLPKMALENVNVKCLQIILFSYF